MRAWVAARLARWLRLTWYELFVRGVEPHKPFMRWLSYYAWRLDVVVMRWRLDAESRRWS